MSKWGWGLLGLVAIGIAVKKNSKTVTPIPPTNDTASDLPTEQPEPVSIIEVSVPFIPVQTTWANNLATFATNNTTSAVGRAKKITYGI